MSLVVYMTTILFFCYKISFLDILLSKNKRKKSNTTPRERNHTSQSSSVLADSVLLSDHYLIIVN